MFYNALPTPFEYSSLKYLHFTLETIHSRIENGLKQNGICERMDNWKVLLAWSSRSIVPANIVYLLHFLRHLRNVFLFNRILSTLGDWFRFGMLFFCNLPKKLLVDNRIQNNSPWIDLATKYLSTILNGCFERSKQKEF